MSDSFMVNPFSKEALAAGSDPLSVQPDINKYAGLAPESYKSIGEEGRSGQEFRSRELRFGEFFEPDDPAHATLVKFETGRAKLPDQSFTAEMGRAWDSMWDHMTSSVGYSLNELFGDGNDREERAEVAYRRAFGGWESKQRDDFWGDVAWHLGGGSAQAVVFLGEMLVGVAISAASGGAAAGAAAKGLHSLAKAYSTAGKIGAVGVRTSGMFLREYNDIYDTMKASTNDVGAAKVLAIVSGLASAYIEMALGLDKGINRFLIGKAGGNAAKNASTGIIRSWYNRLTKLNTAGGGKIIAPSRMWLRKFGGVILEENLDETLQELSKSAFETPFTGEMRFNPFTSEGRAQLGEIIFATSISTIPMALLGATGGTILGVRRDSEMKRWAEPKTDKDWNAALTTVNIVDGQEVGSTADREQVEADLDAFVRASIAKMNEDGALSAEAAEQLVEQMKNMAVHWAANDATKTPDIYFKEDLYSTLTNADTSPETRDKIRRAEAKNKGNPGGLLSELKEIIPELGKRIDAKVAEYRATAAKQERQAAERRVAESKNNTLVAPFESDEDAEQSAPELVSAIRDRAKPAPAAKVQKKKWVIYDAREGAKAQRELFDADDDATTESIPVEVEDRRAQLEEEAKALPEEERPVYDISVIAKEEDGEVGEHQPVALSAEEVRQMFPPDENGLNPMLGRLRTRGRITIDVDGKKYLVTMDTMDGSITARQVETQAQYDEGRNAWAGRDREAERDESRGRDREEERQAWANQEQRQKSFHAWKVKDDEKTRSESQETELDAARQKYAEAQEDLQSALSEEKTKEDPGKLALAVIDARDELRKLEYENQEAEDRALERLAIDQLRQADQAAQSQLTIYAPIDKRMKQKERDDAIAAEHEERVRRGEEEAGQDAEEAAKARLPELVSRLRNETTRSDEQIAADEKDGVGAILAILRNETYMDKQKRKLDTLKRQAEVERRKMDEQDADVENNPQISARPEDDGQGATQENHGEDPGDHEDQARRPAAKKEEPQTYFKSKLKRMRAKADATKGNRNTPISERLSMSHNVVQNDIIDAVQEEVDEFLGEDKSYAKPVLDALGLGSLYNDKNKQSAKKLSSRGMNAERKRQAIEALSVLADIEKDENGAQLETSQSITDAKRRLNEIIEAGSSENASATQKKLAVLAKRIQDSTLLKDIAFSVEGSVFQSSPFSLGSMLSKIYYNGSVFKTAKKKGSLKGKAKEGQKAGHRTSSEAAKFVIEAFLSVLGEHELVDTGNQYSQLTAEVITNLALSMIEIEAESGEMAGNYVENVIKSLRSIGTELDKISEAKNAAELFNRVAEEIAKTEGVAAKGLARAAISAAGVHVLDVGDCYKLYDAARDRYGDVDNPDSILAGLVVALLHGLRPGKETSKMTWGSVQIDRPNMTAEQMRDFARTKGNQNKSVGRVVVDTDKLGKESSVPLSPAAAYVYMKVRAALEKAGRYDAGALLFGETETKVINELLKEHNIYDRQGSTMRHTFATMWHGLQMKNGWAAGGTLDANVEEMLRHTLSVSRSNLRYYLNRSVDDPSVEQFFMLGAHSDFEHGDAVSKAITEATKRAGKVNGEVVYEGGRVIRIGAKITIEQAKAIAKEMKRIASANGEMTPESEAIISAANRIAYKVRARRQMLKTRSEMIKDAVSKGVDKDELAERIAAIERVSVADLDHRAVLGSTRDNVLDEDMKSYNSKVQALLDSVRQEIEEMQKAESLTREQVGFMRVAEELLDENTENDPRSLRSGLMASALDEDFETAKRRLAGLMQDLGAEKSSELEALTAIREKAEQRVNFSVDKATGETKGMYIPHIRAMVFFKNATAETYFHELLHHMISTGLMPAHIQEALLNQFGTIDIDRDEDERKVWSTEAHENAVDAILAFLKEDVAPNVQARGAFGFVAEASIETMEELQARGVEMSQELKEMMSLMVGYKSKSDSTRISAIALTNTYLAAESIDRTEHDAILFSAEKYERQNNAEMNGEEFKEELPADDGKPKNYFARIIFAGSRKGMSREEIMGPKNTKAAGELGELAVRLHKEGVIAKPDKGLIPDRYLAEYLDTLQSKTLRDSVVARLMKEMEISSVNDLTEDQLNEFKIQVDMEMDEAEAQESEKYEADAKKRAKQEMYNREMIPEVSRSISNDLDQAVETEEANAEKVGGRGTLARMIHRGITAMSGSNKVRDIQLSEYSNLRQLAYVASGGDKTSVLYKTIVGSLGQIANARVYLDREYNKIYQKYMSRGDAFDERFGQKITLEGVELTREEAVGLYFRATENEDSFNHNSTGMQAIRRNNKKYQVLNDHTWQKLAVAVKNHVEKDTGDSGWAGYDKQGRFVYMNMKSPDQDTKKAAGFSKVKTWKKVNPSRNFVNFVREYMDMMYKEVGATFELINGVEFAGVEKNFFPMFRTGQGVDGTSSAAMLGIMPQTDLDVDPDPASIRSRDLDAKGEVRLDAMNMFMNYKMHMQNYAASRYHIWKLESVLADSAVAESMDRKYGGDALRDAMRAMLKSELYVTGRTTRMSRKEMMMKTVRQNSTIGFLAGSLPAIARQQASLPLIMSRLPLGALKDLQFSHAQFLKNIVLKPFSTLIGSETPYGNIEDYRFMVEHDPETAGRRFETDVFGLYGQLERGGIMSKTIQGRPISDLGMTAFKNFDMAAVVPVWTASYKYNMRRLENDPSMTADQKHQESVLFAREMVNSTQPPSNLSNRVAAQKGNEWQRWGAMLTSQQMVEYNAFFVESPVDMKNIYNEAIKMGHHPLLAVTEAVLRVGKAADAAHKGPLPRISTAQKLVFSVIIPSFVVGMTFRRRLPSWEEFLTDIAIYPFTKLPFFGPLLFIRLMYDWEDMPSSGLWQVLADGATSLAIKSGRAITEEEYGFFDIFRDMFAKGGAAQKGLAVSTGLPMKWYGFGAELVDGLAGEGAKDGIEWDSALGIQKLVKDPLHKDLVEGALDAAWRDW